MTEKREVIAVNEALVLIRLEFHMIAFEFRSGSVDFQTEFQLVDYESGREVTTRFDPWAKFGNINLLWKLTNREFTDIVMTEETLRLYAADGCYLEVFNINPNWELANVWGFEDVKERDPSEMMLLRSYPSSLLADRMSDEEAEEKVKQMFDEEGNFWIRPPTGRKP